ncbi:uncharacterized protein LOC114969988 [Acropora millepora]|uniref:uncharacterized protein LOC114969988 n=1 Tax=Acropora millepora TaxID=45264 RepID=UPI001CF2370B|nr:uncharacterized protein LOC114969988 [Acropora millepora]
MDKLLKEITTKLQPLEFKQNKAKDIVEKGNTATIEWHGEALVALAKEVDVVKGKIEEKKLEGGNVRAVLNKLKGIKSDLVLSHERWQEWDFRQLLKAIKRWKDINPVTDASQSEIQRREPTYSPKEKNVKNDGFLRQRSYQTRQDIGRQMHGHRAESCRSRGFNHCQRKHRTSICDQTNNAPVRRFLTAQDKGSGKVIYPVVVVQFNCIKCRALLDTGADSSYASSAILDHLRIGPLREEFIRIEMMLGSVNKAIGVYGVTIDSLDGDFQLETEVIKVDRGSFLSLENPKYSEAIQQYHHLKGIQMTDRDDKPELPVHIILGVSDYAKIRTETSPKIGSPGEPVAELTKFGWTIMSPGKEADISSMLLTQTAAADYEQLCKLDVHEEFKEQLTRSAEGWYETRLPWKGNHPTLPNKKAGSLKRLGLLEQYDAIIKDQLVEGIVEPAEEQFVGREFYIPHEPVIRNSAERGVIKQHLENCRKAHPEIVNEIEKSLYVDDFINGGPNVEAAKQVKETSNKVFAQGGSTLHKWHSNATELDAMSANQVSETQETYAKQQLGAPQRGKEALLGVPWDKEKDTIEVKFPTERVQPTKRNLLTKLAKVYDPLGFASPTTLSGKLLYRKACELKIVWDAELPKELVKQLSLSEEGLPPSITVPRPLTAKRETITNIALHCFGDASGVGVSAALYAVVTQPSGVNLGLVTAKARLAKQGLSIPPLELVSGHMAINLITNKRDALEGFPVGEMYMYCWLDSTVALHWIRGAGSYKQFVSNRASKIQQHPNVQWRHLTCQEKPADLGSRGGNVQGEELWWRGPKWLAEKESWSRDIVTKSTPESQAEAQVFAVAREVTDEFHVLLEKFALGKVLRVCAWIPRFANNARKHKEQRTKGPLTTVEIERQTLFWVARAINNVKRREKFEEDRLQLNLQERQDGLLECHGRIQGDYPIYLPDSHPFTEKLTMVAHQSTLHGCTKIFVQVRAKTGLGRVKSVTSIQERFVRSLWKLSGTNRFYEVELTQNSEMCSSEEEVDFSDESPLSSSPEYEIEHESDGAFASPSASKDEDAAAAFAEEPDADAE